MSKGYHSRSPEEFKEYMDSLNKKNKKRNWGQFIILADLIILVLLFIFASNQYKTREGNALVRSEKKDINGFTIYLSRGEDFKEEYSQYFLFVKNTTDKSQTFPEPNTQYEYRLITADNVVCGRFHPEFKELTVQAGDTEFVSIAIPKTLIANSPQECQNIFKKKPKRGFDNILIFFSKHSQTNVQSLFTLKVKATTIELYIKDDSWIQ